MAWGANPTDDERSDMEQSEDDMPVTTRKGKAKQASTPTSPTSKRTSGRVRKASTASVSAAATRARTTSRRRGIRQKPESSEGDDDVEQDDDGEANEEDTADDDQQPSPAKSGKLRITLKLPSSAPPSGPQSDDSNGEDAEGEVDDEQEPELEPINDDMEISNDEDADAEGDAELRYEEQVLDPPDDAEVEEEDEDDLDSDSEGTPVLPGKKKLTARQAVLASVADATHVSLEQTESPRKKTLTAAEMMLKREETARKRKNLSEKKLEDEKAETINRLLKKQSRPRARRMPTSTSLPSSDAGEGTPEEEEPPTYYRWISSTKKVTGEDGEKPTLVLTMGVPVDALGEDAVPWKDASADSEKEKTTQRDGEQMQVDEVQASASTAGITPKGPSKEEELRLHADELLRHVTENRQARCDVTGCGQLRKYRLVRDFTRGACGMEHLKVLQGAA